ncbi:permease [Streptomyces sp. NPDC101227]|uniref:permease n=1 Tax=Streptomyces sp. NPDC101227 TaxID=3366136 RepID=UPI0037F7F42A
MSTVGERTPRTDGATPKGRRGRRLWWQLIRIGCAAGRGGPGDRLRFWALFVAAAAAALVALGAVAAVSTYDGRAARNQARGPVFTDRQQDAVALWREGFDTVDEVQHTVIYLQPLKPGAQPPPGLARWPAPGEVMLSPELVREGQQERITSRYGRYAGTIGTSGLVSPSERLAYIRPTQAPDSRADQSWRSVRGFGQSYPMGEVLDSRPLAQVLLTLGLLTGVPALMLLAVAARVGSRARDRRLSLLKALGGARRHRALVTMGEAALPAAAGTALAILPMLAAMSTDVRIPPTGYLLDSSDLRSAWPMTVTALVLSFATTVGVAVLLTRGPRHGTAVAPRPSSSRVPRPRLIGCGLGFGAVAFSQYVMGTPGLVTFAAGTVVMWALLPSVAVEALRALGDKLAARGFRDGRPGQLIGGRWTVAHPGGVVRLAIAMVIGLGLVCQLQVVNSRVGEKAAAARASQAVVGDSVISVQSRDLTPPVIEALSRSLPAGSHVLTLNTDPEQQATLLQGSCRALRLLGLGCPTTPRATTSGDQRVTEIRHWYGPGLRIQAAPSTLRYDRLYGSLIVITSTTGQRADVEKAAYALVPSVNVETLGEGWLVGSGVKFRLNNWLLLFGSLGLALLLLAGSLSAAAEFARVRHTLVPIAVLTGSHHVFRSAARWHLTVPLLMSAVVAVVLTGWHAMFLVAVMQAGSVPWGVLAAAACGCALAAVAVGALGGRAVVRAARPVAVG